MRLIYCINKNCPLKTVCDRSIAVSEPNTQYEHFCSYRDVEGRWHCNYLIKKEKVKQLMSYKQYE